MTSRPSSIAPILAALAIVLLPLAAYVGGYFCFGEVSQVSRAHDSYKNGHRLWVPDPPMTRRTYRQQWVATIYQPAGAMETWLRGMDVDIVAAWD